MEPRKLNKHFFNTLRVRLENILRTISGNRKAHIIYSDTVSTDCKNKVNLIARNEIAPGIPCSLAELLVNFKASTAHEGAHIRFTSLSAWKEAQSRGPVFQNLINILEDGRIESSLEEDFPGAKKWLDFSNNYIFNHRNPEDYGDGLKAFFGGLIFYSVLQKIPPVPENIQAIVKKAAPYVDIARAASTTEETFECAEEILAIPEVQELVKTSPTPVPLEAKGTDNPEEGTPSESAKKRAEKAKVIIEVRKKKEPEPEAEAEAEPEIEKDKPKEKSSKPKELEESEESEEPEELEESEVPEPEELEESEPEESEGDRKELRVKEPEEPEEPEDYSSEMPNDYDVPDSDSDSDHDDSDTDTGDTENTEDPEDTEDTEGNGDTGDTEDSGVTGADTIPDSEDTDDFNSPGSSKPTEDKEDKTEESPKESSDTSEETEKPEESEEPKESVIPESEDPESEESFFSHEDEPDFSGLLDDASTEITSLSKEASISETESEEIEINPSDFESEVATGIHSGYKLQIYEPGKNPVSYNTLKTPLQPLINKLVEEIRVALETRKAYDLRGLNRGRLNSSSLYKLALNDTTVFSKKVIPGDLPTLAAYLLVDCSASMSVNNRIADAKKATCILSESCRELKIPHTVTGFTANKGKREVVHIPAVKYTDSDSTGIFSLNDISENRDGYSIRIATKELSMRTEKRKVLFILSDGEPLHGGTDYYHTPANKDVAIAVKEARKKNIDVISLYFGDESAIPEFKAMYDTPVFIKNTNMLPLVLGEVFKKVLLS